MQPINLSAGDGVGLPLSWFPAQPSHWSLLFLPALGIQCRMYEAMATALATAGCSVCLLEQRGHGRSTLRANRSANWGFDHYLQYDLPVAMDWMRSQPESTARPIIMGGHSLGGHLSSIFSGQHPDRLQGVLQVACGAPYAGDFMAPKSHLIKTLCRIIPLLKLVPGYFPGSRLGFAGRESLQLMLDWRDWALHGTLNYGPHQGLQYAITAYRGAVLAVSVEGDEFSSLKAEQRAIAGFSSARVSQVRLGKVRVGSETDREALLDHEPAESLGHFGWARKPDAAVHAILHWLQEEFPLLQGASLACDLPGRPQGDLLHPRASLARDGIANPA